jgi:uncharacterized repeat protein (TIGR01451 family)
VIVSNSGTAAAYNVKIDDTFSSSNGIKHGVIKTESGATYSDGVFDIVSAIPANGSRAFIYNTTLSSMNNATGVNTAKIKSFEATYKCPKINESKGIGRTSSAYVKSGKTPNAQYVLDKTANKHSVKPGDIVTYTLSIKNTGKVDIKNVYLTDKFPSEFLEPVERFKVKLKDNRTLEFKQKFLPIGDTFSVKVEMIVRKGVPNGTEIKNILTARSDTVEIRDKSMETIFVRDGQKPTCPVGYKWQADLNTCKRNKGQIPKSGFDSPLLPIGIILLGFAFIVRRKDIANFLS